MRRYVLALALVLAAAPCSALEKTLDNGLRVILIPHRANPMVASAVVVGAGVVDEGSEASGASHFLEHLLFDGTESRTQRQLYDDVDRLGAYNNATTREDHTLFTFLVAKEHAEDGLAIQADMLFRSTIPAESFEKERNIVLEELARDRTDPSYDLNAAFRAVAYAGTPIAGPVLGTETSLGVITRAQVLAYYKARYVPSNMALVVMGDFEIPEMLAAVGRTFGAVPAAPAPRTVAGRWPPPPKDNLEVAPAEKEPTRLLATFPFDASPWDDTTMAAGVLLAAASDGKDSPLARALSSRGVKDNAASLRLDPRRAPWSTVVFDTRVDSGIDPKAVLDALCDAVRATRPGGEARARIGRVLATMRSDAAIGRDQIHYFAMLRSSSILGSPSESLTNETARLDALGPADWDAASARLSAGLAAIRARIAGPGLAAKRLSWAPRAEAQAAVQAPPSASTGALANGLRYVVRESPDSDVFAMHVAFVPRAAGEPEGQEGITDLLHRAMARGTILHDPAALEARLAALGARVKAVDDPSVPFDDYYTTPEFSWLRLEVPASQWREAAALLAEMIRVPALSQEALDEGRRDMKERVTRREGSPRDVAAGALDALVAPGNPWIKPVYGTAASLQAITLDGLKSFHAAFAVGRRTIVTVLGPVAPAEVARAIESDFGALPTGSAVEKQEPPPPTSKPSSVDLKLGKSQAYLAMGTVLEVAPADRAALAIAVAMLSDRLAFDLRETKGLAYSIAASVRYWGGRTRFDVAMGTRAENLAEARAGIVSGIVAFRDSTPIAADVERAVNRARGSALMRRMTRISLAYEAALEAMRELAPGDERRFFDSLREVRADDVKRVAKHYLDPDGLAVAVVR